MPWRLAFALQADGWWLRQDIIWAKPNPMPESVRDRCTKAHEYLFLLTKSERYYFDADAIAEPAGNDPGPGVGAWATGEDHSAIGHNRTGTVAHGDKVKRTNGKHASMPSQLSGHRIVENVAKARENGADHDSPFGSTRNKRSVWTVTTQPFKEAHFATFPPALIEPCILAGTSERGCCSSCGKPWLRVTEETEEYAAFKAKQKEKLGPDYHMKRAGLDAVKGHNTGGNGSTVPQKNDTIGWRAQCECGGDPAPCVVLDPFGGAGTTGLVADRLQRDAILIELNPEYAEMARKRIHCDAPLFAEVGP